MNIKLKEDKVIAILRILTGVANEVFYTEAFLKCPMEAEYSYSPDEIKKMCSGKEYCDLDGQRAAVLKHHCEVMEFEHVDTETISKVYDRTLVEVKLRCRTGTRIG